MLFINNNGSTHLSNCIQKTFGFFPSKTWIGNRFSVNKHGEAIPNYHYEDLRLLWEKYQEKNLRNPAVIVDTNHSNSNKQYDQQVRIAKEVLHSRHVDPELHTLVKGLMIESYIEPGNADRSVPELRMPPVRQRLLPPAYPVRFLSCKCFRSCHREQQSHQQR